MKLRMPKAIVAMALQAADTVRFSPLLLPSVSVPCPVCGCARASAIRYGSFSEFATGAARERTEISEGHEKFRCRSCGHLFTTWFPTLEEYSLIYSRIYADDRQLVPNARREHQETLIRRLVARRGAGGRYLDFGCGGNFSIALEMQKEGLDVHACDIHTDYPYDGDVVFRFDPSHPEESAFDGISSLDAIEHVQDIEGTWRYFNRTLRPGGLMVHSFPSVFRYGYGHFFSRQPIHSCLFSRTSLAIWSEKMGFAYLGPEELAGSDVPECYWFAKVKSL